jgi:hypothetical protein
MQECIIEVGKQKKSYTNFVVHVGSDPYIVESIMVKNNLKIPDSYEDNPQYLQAKADLMLRSTNTRSRDLAVSKRQQNQVSTVQSELISSVSSG